MIILKEEIILDTVLAQNALPHLDLNSTLFLDIETTGFSSKYCMIYMIGSIEYCNQIWLLTQYICEKKEDEYELLFRFAKDLQHMQTLVHYNGKSFDIPFIKTRMKLYNISSTIDNLDEIDIYIESKKIKKYLPLKNLKLKTVETFFDFQRQDAFTGGELISVYKEFAATQSDSLLKKLSLHNKEDLLGLYKTLKLYDYIQLFTENLSTVLANHDIKNNSSATSVHFTISYPCNINHALSINDWHIQFSRTSITVKAPIINATLNYYIKNYKDYYYLHKEDRVIHKSLASFVDSNHKEKANAQNCFIPKKDFFIPFIPIEGVKAFQKNLKEKKYMVLNSSKFTPHIIIEYLLNSL